jgi:hypothetical protein
MQWRVWHSGTVFFPHTVRELGGIRKLEARCPRPSFIGANTA